MCYNIKKLILLVIFAITTVSCSLLDNEAYQEMKRDRAERGKRCYRIVMEIYFVKTEMEIVINKSSYEEVELLRFCFFFAFERKKNIIILNIG